STAVPAGMPSQNLTPDLKRIISVRRHLLGAPGSFLTQRGREGGPETREEPAEGRSPIRLALLTAVGRPPRRRTGHHPRSGYKLGMNPERNSGDRVGSGHSAPREPPTNRTNPTNAATSSSTLDWLSDHCLHVTAQLRIPLSCRRSSLTCEIHGARCD